jgi:hypothetical protein
MRGRGTCHRLTRLVVGEHLPHVHDLARDGGHGPLVIADGNGALLVDDVATADELDLATVGGVGERRDHLAAHHCGGGSERKENAEVSAEAEHGRRQMGALDLTGKLLLDDKDLLVIPIGSDESLVNRQHLGAELEEAVAIRVLEIYTVGKGQRMLRVMGRSRGALGSARTPSCSSGAVRFPCQLLTLLVPKPDGLPFDTANSHSCSVLAREVIPTKRESLQYESGRLRDSVVRVDAQGRLEGLEVDRSGAGAEESHDVYFEGCQVETRRADRRRRERAQAGSGGGGGG